MSPSARPQGWFTPDQYFKLKEKVIDAGYSKDVEWAENLKPCISADNFFCEYMWVVLNSGMKNQIAAQIERRIYDAWERGESTVSAFGHKGKVTAIEFVRQNRDRLFNLYLYSEDKLACLEALPWIGKLTKYHLAKNLGHDCCKPDRHLMRIAKRYNSTPDSLCKRLSAETGDRIALVDLVIWRAANLGMI
jgi:hypothetical protein